MDARNGLLDQVFEALNDEVEYCLLRRPDESALREGRDDVDLLIPHGELAKAARLFRRLGFVCLRELGYSPHHFFLAYDRRHRAWIKLDVVHDLIYGRPRPCLRFDLATGCLEGRTREGHYYVPAPDYEFTTLLFHCLFDKRSFSGKHAERLSVLLRSCDRRHVATLTRDLPSEISWSQVEAACESARWEILANASTRVFRRVFLRQLPFSGMRLLTGLLLRKLPAFGRGQGFAVSLIAPDGAGKTTIARRLAQDRYLRARLVYMGGNTDSASVSLPTTRWLANHPTARGLNFCNRLVEQWFRLAVATYHKTCGRFVVFDRYLYDLCLAPPAQTLGKRLRRRLLSYSWSSPDLTVLLDAPGELLFRRKREHSPERLEAQRRKFLKLGERLPDLVVVDASRESEVVYNEVLSMIWERRFAPHQERSE